MSYHPAPPTPKAFTPAIITALVALVLLAVITVVVITRNTSDSTTANAPGSTTTDGPSPSASTSTASAYGNGVPSDDDTFTYVKPEGFSTDPNLKLYVVSLSNDMAVGSTNPDDATYFTTFVLNVPGQSLEEVTSKRLESAKSTWDGVEIGTPLVAEIDGEEAAGIVVPAYAGSTGTSIALDEVIVMHRGNSFTFAAQYPSASQDEARAAFIEFLNSVQWSY